MVNGLVLIAYPRTRQHDVEWAYRIPDQASLSQQTFTPRIAEDTAAFPARGFTIGPVNPAERADEERETGTDE